MSYIASYKQNARFPKSPDHRLLDKVFTIILDPHMQNEQLCSLCLGKSSPLYQLHWYWLKHYGM